MGGDPLAYWNKDKAGISMDTVREEDEEVDPYISRKSFKLGPPSDQANSSRAALPVYSRSIRSSSPLIRVY